MHSVRTARVALILALLWIAVPVVAHHALEPTAPVVGLELRIYNYGLGIQTTRLACDGLDVIDWKQVRIETDVTVEAVPSEHWDQELRVSMVDRFVDGQPRGRRAWDSFWRHQNQGAHRNPPDNSSVRVASTEMESSENNQYQLQDHLGFWLVETTLDGLESDRHLEASCLFRVIASTEG